MVPPARLSPAQAQEIARRHYGLTAAARRLPAELDDVFWLTAADGTARLLKISAGADLPAPPPVSLQAALLLHLAAVAPGVPVQRVVPAADGRPEVRLAEGGHQRLVLMTSWLDGGLLSQATSTVALRRDTGAALGRLSSALRGFSHPGARRTHRWDLQRFTALRPLLGELPPPAMLPEVSQALAADGRPDGWLRAELGDCLDRFAAVTAPRLARTAVQVVHTDFHGENLLTDGERVTGILDFGDALTGPVAMDLGVAACYQLGQGPDVLAPALDVVAGYHGADPLTAGDLDLAAEFIVARLATRIIVSQWNAVREPANRGYLLRRTPQAITQFTALRRQSPDETSARLRAACGM